MTPEAFRDYLTRVDLTYQEFAEIIGVTHGAASHWLTGIRKMPPTVVKLIEHFEENIRDFGDEQ